MLAFFVCGYKGSMYNSADIFKKLNMLNLSMWEKGEEKMMLTWVSSKSNNFWKKFVLWKKHFDNECLEILLIYVIFIGRNKYKNCCLHNI